MPIHINSDEVEEFIKYYLESPLDITHVKTVQRLIHAGVTRTNFPRMTILAFDESVQRTNVEEAVINLWLAGMFMGIAFEQRRKELAELKRQAELQEAPCQQCMDEMQHYDGGVIETPCRKHQA